MRILHTTMKTLLICTTMCACLYADDTAISASTPSETDSVEKAPGKKPGRVTVVTRRQSGRSSRTARMQADKSKASPSLFFSATGSAETRTPDVASEPIPLESSRTKQTVDTAPALPRVASTTTTEAAPSRHRMQVSNVSDEPVGAARALKSSDVAASDNEAILPAAFETAENPDASDIKQVSAEESNPFAEADFSDDTPVLSFEETETPGLQAEDDFAHNVDEFAQKMPAPAVHEFAFDAQPVSFESGSTESQGFSDADVTPSAVPHTEGGGLPSQHTGIQSPQVDVHWEGEGTLNIGQRSQCSLIVTNSGSSLVRNVVVEAAIPPGVDVVQALPAPQSGTSRWSVGDLEPGQKHAIEMIVVPRERGDVALNAFVRFTGYSTSVFAVQEPMLQMQVEGPDSVTVGEQPGYVITVHNPGTGVAQNVVIEARVPEGLQHRSGSVPRIDVGILNPGESRQARLNLSAIAGGDYRLAVRTLADGGLRDEARADISIAEPRLEVAINGPQTGSLDKPAEYLVTVTNSGNVPSINVRAKYKIPEGFHFVHADRGGVMQEAEHLVDWFVGTLQPGETSEYHVTLTPDVAGTALHRAGVVSEHTSASMASHSVDVKGLPKLALNVSTAESSAVVGEETVVQIVIRNEGGIAASKVGLFCELPSGLEFIAAAGPSEHLADNGVVIFRSLAGIDAGETVTYRVKARCVRTGDHRIRARVASESLSDPVNSESVLTGRNGR